MSLIVQHPLYGKVVANLERTVVRDKLLRLVQYFSRFLTFYLYRKGYSAASVAQFAKLAKALSLARKAFRAGRPLASFRSAAVEFGNHTGDSIVHIALLAKNIFNGLYLTVDTVVFLGAIGALRLKPAQQSRLTNASNALWAGSIFSALLDAVRRLYIAQQRKRALSSDEKAEPEEIKRSQLEIAKAKRATVLNLLDATIPLTGLKLLNLDDGAVGLAGTVTSYMGLSDIW